MGGTNRKILDQTGKEWLFEDHPYYGPVVLNGKGDPIKKEPDPKSLFWKCVNQWYAQGKKIEDGLCLWTPEKKMKFKHIVGKRYMFDGYED